MTERIGDYTIHLASEVTVDFLVISYTSLTSKLLRCDMGTQFYLPPNTTMPVCTTLAALAGTHLCLSTEGWPVEPCTGQAWA